MSVRRLVAVLAAAALVPAAASAQRVELSLFGKDPVRGELKGFDRGEYTVCTADGEVRIPESQVVEVRVLDEGGSLGRISAVRAGDQLPDTAMECYEFAQGQRRITGNLAVVKSALDKALELDPKFLAAYVALGEVCLDLENFRGAEEAWQKALSLNSAHEGANELKARYLEKVGRPAEAQEVRLAAVGRLYSEPEASYRMAHKALEQGDLAKAAEHWKAYLAKDPERRGTFNAEARAMREAADLCAKDRRLEAIERMQSALRGNPLLRDEVERAITVALEEHLRTVEAHPDPVAALNDVYTLLHFDPTAAGRVREAVIRTHLKAAARLIEEGQADAFDRFLARMGAQIPEDARREVLAGVLATLKEALEKSPADRIPSGLATVFAAHLRAAGTPEALRMEAAVLLAETIRRAVGHEAEEALTNRLAQALRLADDPTDPDAAPLAAAVRGVAARALASDHDALAGRALDFLDAALPADPETLALRAELAFVRVRRDVQTARNNGDALAVLDRYLASNPAKPDHRSWAEAQRGRVAAAAAEPDRPSGVGGADLDVYYPMEPGRFWVYQHADGDRDRVTLAQVEEENGVRSALFTLDAKIPDVQYQTSYRRFRDDQGVYLLEDDGKVNLLRRPLAAGARWAWESGPITFERRVTGYEESVTLGTGLRFDHCLVIEFKSTHTFDGKTLTHMTREVYAPGVGLIQSVFTPGDDSAPATCLELASYGRED